MRYHSISGSSVYIEYPDQLTWLGDNNIIRIRSSISTDHVGARVTVTEPSGGQQVLDYWSETNSLVFLLNDTLKSLFANNLSDWSVMIEAYNSLSPLTPFTFNMKVFDGKSFPDRSHAAERVIYWSDADELRKIQVFTYEGGTATVANTPFALTPGITSLNLSNLHLHGDVSIHIQTTHALETTPEYLGDMWHNTRVPNSDYDIRMEHIQICDDSSNACRVFYTNTDGCVRWIGGKIVKQTDNAQGETYQRIDSLYRNIARKHNTKLSKVLTVAFSDIDALAYLTDIMWSDRVQMVNYNGDFFDVAIDTKKLQSKDLQDDFEIDFIITSEK